MPTKKVKSHCSNCERETNHEVLAEKAESYRDEYACDIAYQIVECLGCENRSFRKLFVDIESAFPVSDNEWEVPEEVDTYPKFVEGHRRLQDDHHLPNIVETVYREVLLALQEDALILAGLGLRATVEAVCNDLDIAGRNLETRITKLATQGYISKRDSERLHAIRFMGNDAAHDIKPPKVEGLRVALRIVEHLLAATYILPKQADGKLETAITDFEKFVELLDTCLNRFAVGDEVPLAEIMGKELRRIKEAMLALEQDLSTAIAAGDFPRLKIGKKAKSKGSKAELQHYIVVSDS